MLQDSYKNIKSHLKQAGIENPELEARVILKSVTNVSDAALLSGENFILAEEEIQKIENILGRRQAEEPLSRILGQREFWGLTFKVTPDVLDPRPDTETVIEAALKHFKDKNAPQNIIDLGTGSGCILTALLKEFPRARGVAVDISDCALAVAQDNMQANGVVSRARFIQGAWFESVDEKFDLVVSNPPYIPSADIPGLESSVRNHDPILALDGGESGLEAYESILSVLKSYLSTAGISLFEVGMGQSDDVARLAAKYGLCVDCMHDDLAGIARVVQISMGKN